MHEDLLLLVPRLEILLLGFFHGLGVGHKIQADPLRVVPLLHGFDEVVTHILELWPTPAEVEDLFQGDINVRNALRLFFELLRIKTESLTNC